MISGGNYVKWGIADLTVESDNGLAIIRVWMREKFMIYK